MSQISRNLTVSAIGLLLAGCAYHPEVASQGPSGSVVLSVNLHNSQSIQYLVADANAMRVTVSPLQKNGSTVSTLFAGATLTAHLSGQTFSCTIANLHAGSDYQATVEALLAIAPAILIGSMSSSVFRPGNQQAIVALPDMTLIATPLGSASVMGSMVDHLAPVAIIR